MPPGVRSAAPVLIHGRAGRSFVPFKLGGGADDRPERCMYLNGNAGNIEHKYLRHNGLNVSANPEQDCCILCQKAL